MIPFYKNGWNHFVFITVSSQASSFNKNGKQLFDFGIDTLKQGHVPNLPLYLVLGDFNKSLNI